MNMIAESPMVVRDVTANGFVRVNAAFCELTGFEASVLAERPFLDWIVPHHRGEVQDLLESKRAGWCRAMHSTRDEGLPGLKILVRTDADCCSVVGRGHTVRRSVDSGNALDEGAATKKLETLARMVEEQNPGYLCSILLAEQNRFVLGAAPSLPQAFNKAIDGAAIGPTVGSCGTAIYWNLPVIVEDIQADPLWRDMGSLAKSAGVSACWSHPFANSSGEVLGSLALYSREPRRPTGDQLSRLRIAARMTGIAVERERKQRLGREGELAHSDQG